MWGVLFDFQQLVAVVIGNEGLVAVKRLECLLGFGGIGENDLVPDKVLLLLGRKVFYVFINQHELLK